jgi:hypothetical protein
LGDDGSLHYKNVVQMHYASKYYAGTLAVPVACDAVQGAVNRPRPPPLA